MNTSAVVELGRAHGAALPEGPGGRSRLSSSWLRGGVLVALLAGAAAGAWRLQGNAIVAAVSSKPAAASPTVAVAPIRVVHAEGRLLAIPGAEVVVGTDVGGTLRSMRVEEKATVKKGALLAEIASEEARASLAEAQGRITQAEVDITFFTSEAQRTDALFRSSSLPQQAVDRAVHDRDAAIAQRRVSTATAARLAATLAKTRVVAPIDGVVLERHAEAGETVAPGAPLVTIADLTRTRVEAEVDEFDAARIAVDEDVAIRIEGASGSFRGKVTEIPDAVVSRRLKPQDPTRPSDTRVLVVKIAPVEMLPAKLGQRVEVEIAAP